MTAQLDALAGTTRNEAEAHASGATHQLDEWTVTQTEWGAATNKAWEGLLAQGNGYFHVRGSFEEGLRDDPQNLEYERKMESVTVETPAHSLTRQGVYAPIITGFHPEVRQTVINLPWFADVRITVDGEAFDMAYSTVTSYSRALDWRTAVMTRRVTWQTVSGCQINLIWERFASQSNRHLFVQRVRVEVCSGTPLIEWESGIVTDVVTNGHRHFHDIEAASEGTTAFCTIVTDNEDTVAIASRVLATPTPVVTTSVSETGATLSWCEKVGEDAEFELVKFTALTTSRDAEIDMTVVESPLPRALAIADAAADWDTELAASTPLLATAWANADRADRASAVDVPHLRWATYHLLRATPAFPGVTQVCPKGFAGEAYYGRYFWDSEIYLLPFYLQTDRESARGFLDYRYNTLEGARRNARAYNCRGAKYPWQSGSDGTEQCSLWEYADNELHVTADVAYAVVRYVQHSGDWQYMWERGLEILIETARFWVDRADWDRDGVAHLINVMGPDEYSPMTRDNAFTNRMVQFNLTQAVAWAGELSATDPSTWVELTNRLGLLADELTEFERLAEALPIPHDPDRQLVLQSADFEDYAEIDIDAIWRDRSKPFGAFVSHEKLYRSRCLKQADVVALISLFPEEFTDEQADAAYEYYKRYTVHDSSLSPAAHVQVAYRLGKLHDVERFVQQMIAVDFDLERGGAADGMHIANCACIWQLADLEVSL